GEPVGRDLAGVRQADDDARDLAAAERHDEELADGGVRGCEVVERPVQRTGRRQRLDLGDGGHGRGSLALRSDGVPGWDRPVAVWSARTVFRLAVGSVALALRSDGAVVWNVV